MMTLPKNKKNASLWRTPTLICFFVILMEPAYVKQALPDADMVFNLLQVAVALIVFVKYMQMVSISGIFVWIALYYLVLISSTIVNDGAIKATIFQAASFLSICMLIELVMTQNYRKLFSSLLVVLEVYSLINLATIVLIPEGLYSTDLFDDYYFLGYRNQMINFILPCLCLELLNCHYGSPSKTAANIRTVLAFVVALLSVVIAGSGASSIVIAAMGLYLLFGRHLPSRVFNFRIYLVINIFLFFFIVVFRMQDVFINVIDALQRDATLTGRVYIWDKTFYFIQHNWLIGYGVEEYADRVLQYASLGPMNIDRAAGLHAHDRYLETMYRGGILLLICYFGLLLTAGNKLFEGRKTTSAQIISFSLFVYLTGMITEFYEYAPLFFGLLVIGYYCNEFASAKNGMGGDAKEEETDIKLTAKLTR